MEEKEDEESGKWRITTKISQWTELLSSAKLNVRSLLQLRL